MASYGMCHPIRRVACHHCGNIRKNQVKCIACPQLYCRNCSEKIKQEHGSQVFADGCPVCKKLCCCAEKSHLCTRQNHCYRKCPVSKLTKAIISNSSGINHLASVNTSLSSKLFDRKGMENSVSGPNHAAAASKQPDSRHLSCSIPNFPLEMLAAAACEQFETTNTTINAENDNNGTPSNKKNTIGCSSTDEQTTVEDISDISSADGDSTIQAKTAAARSNNKRSASSLENSQSIHTNSINSVATNNSIAPPYMPIHVPMDWWALQNNLLQMSHAMNAMGASDGTNANTPPKIVWLPVLQSSVTSGDNNRINNLAFDAKRARFNYPSFMPFALPVEGLPRGFQESGSLGYDWVVRPSPVSLSPPSQQQSLATIAIDSNM